MNVDKIKRLLAIFPITAIVGPRQSGKTTLADQIPHDHYLDLENPRDLAKLDEPQLFFEPLSGLIIIDEIQLKPELFPLLRHLVDRNPQLKYLILGSASPALLKKTSETLAGRIGYHQLGVLTADEVQPEEWKKLWLRGGFPRSFLAKDDASSHIWRQNYIQTFMERDIPQLGIGIPAQTLRRFWIMLCHYHGQILNYAELGRSFGISDMTIRRYIEILEGTFMVRVLAPWFMNIGKRLVRQPKIYMRDSGLFHALMAIETEEQLRSFHKLGASWEGFAMENVCRLIESDYIKPYFWSTHTGAEVDLFWQHGGKNYAVEFKYMDAPRITKSMRIAVSDLQLDQLWVVYPGQESYALGGKISAISLQKMLDLLKK